MLAEGGSNPIVDGAGTGTTSRVFWWDTAVSDLYAHHRLAPVLRRLLIHSSGLLNTVTGSISVVEPGRGRYAKFAEQGASCRLGQTFPLDEGATGCAVACRRPVVIDDYSQVRAGHLPVRGRGDRRAGDPHSERGRRDHESKRRSSLFGSPDPRRDPRR